MSQQDPQPVFGYKAIEILRGEGDSLGIGSYGAVYKARCDDLPCAAKILHPTLFQSNDPGARRLLQRFEQECSFMNRIRHPNIVLYLGVCRDTHTGLPVLLMELLDESLTKFLEKSKKPLPFHIQVNLCHDIALAIAYLHSNNIIHRDLSSNNVLLIAGSRAKVTDFGMSKLADSGGLMSRFSRLSLTYCPGTEVYMPPEAVNNKPVYTEKLDCFSFGPLVIQIITRIFPKPGERTKAVPFPGSPTGTIEIPILETERRQSHIYLIDPEHLLLPIALDCLQYKSEDRPTAHEICLQLATIKEDQQYGKSKWSCEDKDSQQERALEYKDEEIRQLKEHHKIEIQGKDDRIQELTRALERKEKELTKLRDEKKVDSSKTVANTFDLANQQPPRQQPYVSTHQYQKGTLHRSISTTNIEMTNQCRSLIQQDWTTGAPIGGTNFFTRTPCFTFTLPHLNDYPEDFRKFVFDNLINREMQRYMEAEHCLNWCRSTATLHPLYTMGDGNDLLHAASLGMWGFQDRNLILRRAVYHALQNHMGNTFMERWKYSLQLENQQQGWQLDAQQMDQEWAMMVQRASTEAAPGKPLDSLKEFHIFVLANVLRRPIIIYAGPKLRSAVNDATLQNLNFHGIYLPLLWDPKSCKKDPLPLGYYGGHFSALSATDTSLNRQGGPHLNLPLCDYYGKILPVRFSLSMEEPNSLLIEYLDLTQVNLNSSSPYITNSRALCAKLSIPEMPKYLKPLISGFIDACWEAYGAQQQARMTIKCPHCSKPGQPMFLGLCETCYRIE